MQKTLTNDNAYAIVVIFSGFPAGISPEFWRYFSSVMLGVLNFVETKWLGGGQPCRATEGYEHPKNKTVGNIM